MVQRLKGNAAVNPPRIWKNAALGAGFVAVLAAPMALHAMVAPPPPPRVPVVQAAKISAANSFTATCTAAEVVDSRPEPAWVAASFEGDNCWAPKAPAAFNGEIASRGEIVAAIAAVAKYNTQLGSYQRCIATAVASRKEAAARVRKPLEVAFVTIETHRLTVAEENRKKAKQRLAAEVEAFNAPGSECN